MSGTVRFGDSDWPVLFGMGALRRLGAKVAPDDDALDWLPEHLQALASGDVRALVLTLWAGMEGRPDDPADLLDLLGEADPGEFELLGETVTRLLQDSIQTKTETEQARESGQPWSWNVAEAVWSTEWGQSAEKFESTTLAQFTALSNGRAVLYASAAGEKPQQFEDVDPMDLIRNGPRWGRRSE
jgi:hypothetical protein